MELHGITSVRGATSSRIDPVELFYRSNHCSTTGVSTAVIRAILSMEWCI